MQRRWCAIGGLAVLCAGVGVLAARAQVRIPLDKVPPGCEFGAVRTTSLS